MSDHRHLATLAALLREDVAVVERLLAGPSRVGSSGGFGRFVERHRVAGYAYRRLDESGLLPLVPEVEREAMKHFYLRQWTRNEQLAVELERLAGHFELSGRDVLFIKGPLFAHRFYGDLDRRAISDLDILIRSEADRVPVDASLRELGYRRSSRTLLGPRVTAKFVHHFEYWSRDGIPLEMHWALQRHPSFRLSSERLWGDSHRVAFRGRDYPTLSTEYELVAQALGAAVDLQVGKLTLKPFVDAHHILQSSGASPEWERFMARRREEGIETIATVFLTLLLDLFECADEHPDLDAALRHARSNGKAGSVDPRLALAARRLDLQSRLAAMRLYDSPAATTWSWWLCSLPFRLVAYREETRQLFRRSAA